ncbi:MAG TPA: tRNA (adenosine(37)-N6)-threonylcarbamoyltransferase complex dimerization subunit type 1 TsaB, partial [Terriglobales bacterium]|nr:tRNA (adenosine(37)-N6)-threonylcarbamoyltransferase complex dimerization subunit type 1 TsaB [Terriglobales bacterium]
MRVLGVDTSTWLASVGLVDEGRVVAERHESVRSNHGTSLLPLIASVLTDAGIAIGEIDAVAVAKGPGSFTGLRISLSVAKGLALATGARVVGVPTLPALARAAGRDGV